MQVNLRKNENENSRGYGKYYFEVDRKQTLSLEGFAKHLSEHGGRYKYGEYKLILEQIVDCLLELTSQGIPVELHPLGIFSVGIKNKKNGLTKQQVIDGTYDVSEQIEGVKMNFLPTGTEGDDFTSREFAKRCSFEVKDIVATEYDTDPETQKRKAYLTRTPLATWIHDESQPEP